MQHIFLADVHLGAFHERKNQQLESALIKLIDYCEANEIQMHLLGDLFDYWMEYKDYTSPLGNTVLKRFRSYNETHPSLFVTGNHDFWTRGHFSKMGFRTEPEYATLQLENKSTLLFHGDGLSDPSFSLPRPFLNNFIRKPWFVDLFQYILGGEAGNHFMKVFSDFTRDDELNPKRLSEWAEEYLSKMDYDVIITGHDHVPRVETFDGGMYINTGAFYRYNTVVHYTNNTFRLVVWNSEKNDFLPFADKPNIEFT
ncbi:MAG: metallophosphoesterase family protein [Balneolaceae bacterium]|nr:metallophosphoesterase family protein [Balneolaceae bacterium]